ncbi:P-loop containing nucleoside triphosphate hydrolase protein, partial [Aureobasidium melanogenum]
MTAAIVTRTPLHTLSMTGAQTNGIKRKSLRYHNDHPDEDAPPNKKSKATNTTITSKNASQNTVKKAKKSYDEGDDGFVFTRRTGKAKAKAPDVALEPETTAGASAPALEEQSVQQPPPPTDEHAPIEAIEPPRKKPRKTLPTSPEPTPRRRSKRLSGNSPVHNQEHATSKPTLETQQQQRSPATPPPATVDQENVAPAADGSPALDQGELTIHKKRGPAKIPLPFGETPVLRRNKEMRKLSAEKSRRSSSGMRGRRASSLIEAGSSRAVPHSQVETNEFYKHISQDLVEPKRMRQLLLWCGHRALPEKSAGGQMDAAETAAMHAARVIQEELLNEFSSRNNLSYWYDREDTTPTVLVKKPNPRNIQNAEKLQQLEAELARLQEEKRAWDDLLSSTAPPKPSTNNTDAEASSQGQLDISPQGINPALLDPSQADLLQTLLSGISLNPSSSESSTLAQTSTLETTKTRVGTIASTLEFKIDKLADGAHKLEQYRAGAQRLADHVLAVGAEKLEERDKSVREKTSNANPIGVVEEILASQRGLKCLHDAFNIDDTPEYVDIVLQPMISWLQFPALQSASNGFYLRRTLQALVNPPGSRFWKAYHSHVKYELVDERSIQCFAWLLLQLLTNTCNVRPYDLMIAKDPLVQRVLADSSYDHTRYLGQRIQRVYALHQTANPRRGRDVFQPQHNNDFQNFKDIGIFPTTQEVVSDTAPRIWRAAEVFEEPDPTRRLYIYLANLFWLYRQDWLEEIKEQVQIALGKETEAPRNITTRSVKLTGVSCRDTSRKHGQHPWSLKLECSEPLPELKDLNPEQRKAFIKDDPDFMQDGALGSIVADGEPVAIVKILRDEALLARSIICIQIPHRELISQAILAMMNAASLDLVLLNTAGYAYEPVLGRLQTTTELPFEEELLFWDKSHTPTESKAYGSGFKIREIVKQLEERPESNLQDIMKLKSAVVLDCSQAASLAVALKQRLSLVQGPPGTGKSFIGALAAKVLHDHTDEKILVVCHTNQALDQFTQDIRKVGVQDSQIVRLGGVERTDPANHNLLLSSLRIDSTYHSSRDARSFVKDLERQVLDESRRLEDLYRDLTSLNLLRGHLDELALKGDPRYSQAFEISLEPNGTTRITEDGTIGSRHYLLQRWIEGKDPGVFPEKKKYTDVWCLSLQQRKVLVSNWRGTISHKALPAFLEMAEHHDDLLGQARNANGQVSEQIIRSKRIIACTTSGAAKYPQVLSEAPGIIIVEEAGQVLESHIVTALNPTAKQLIMIGDHKQLRPFVNYDLSVEKGDGYDLNRSMFERLVLKGYPHQVLAQQHRMRPEISGLVRQLTYPDLIDAPKTQNRPDLRGFSDNVIFVNHNHPEDTVSEDPTVINVRTSKRNTYEAEMAFKTVKYLLQQNYNASNIVVLTPYLGQLKKLQEVFGRGEVETVLSDFDIKNMEKNGLIEDVSEVKGASAESVEGTPSATTGLTKPPASAHISILPSAELETKAAVAQDPTSDEPLATTTTSITMKSFSEASPQKPKIQISTIDNYQGQESDIVVASLVRSNPDHDIGFLSSPERLNVLLSRARNALILFGNTETLRSAHTGKETWTKLFSLLEEGGHMYTVTKDLESMSSLEATSTARTALEQFDVALEANSTDELEKCFCPEQAFWKDQLALTWHLRTFISPAQIAKDLLETKNLRDITGSFEIIGEAQFVQAGPTLKFIVCPFGFKTGSPAATCSGMMWLLPVERQASDDGTSNLTWKIWILSTKLESLDEHVEDKSLLGSTDKCSRGLAEINTDVFIVGAGNAAVALATRLKALGVHSVMIDRNPSVGDNWALRYDCMKFHIPTSFCELPYLRYPDELQGQMLTRDDLAAHVRNYAQTFKLDIINSAEIIQTTQGEDGQWQIKFRTADRREVVATARHLVQATGIGSQKPYVPPMTEREAYKGTSLHSSEYKNAVELKSQGKKTVCIVDSANTAFDVLEDCHAAGLQVTIISRSPTYMVPLEYVCDKYSLGAYDFGVEAADNLFMMLPTIVDAQLGRGLFAQLASKEPDRYSALKDLGFPFFDSRDPDAALMHNLIERGGGHYVDTGATALLTQKKVDFVAGVEPKEYTSTGLRLSDGTTLEADAVI